MATEDYIRNLLIDVLYKKLGQPGTLKGSGKSTQFQIKDEYKNFKCIAEQKLSYLLPTRYSMRHTSDIHFENESKNKFISSEVKHESSVTDQFKCRSYDMIQLKNTYKNNLLGIMVYVRKGNISIDHAKEICYPFDVFVGFPFNAINDPNIWDSLIKEIAKFTSV